MLIAIVLAALTGWLVHRKRYDWAAFTAMLFVVVLAFTFMGVINFVFLRSSHF